MPDRLREAFRRVLENEGVDSEGGTHSWRCFDKERYPEPCGCIDEIVNQLIAAVNAETP